MKEKSEIAKLADRIKSLFKSQDNTLLSEDEIALQNLISIVTQKIQSKNGDKGLSRIISKMIDDGHVEAVKIINKIILEHSDDFKGFPIDKAAERSHDWRYGSDLIFMKCASCGFLAHKFGHSMYSYNEEATKIECADLMINNIL